MPAWYRLSFDAQNEDLSRAAVVAGLRALPILSLVADPDALFSAETGIYSHPQERGTGWERAVAAEMADTAGHTMWECGAGLRLHGGTSREPGQSPKHSLRLVFKARYGPPKLAFPLFGPNGPREFDSVILRAGNNHSWLDSDGDARRHSDYVRDEWMRQSQRAMGYPSARGCFVHLFLNGLYWGVYNLCERPGPALLADAPADVSRFDTSKAGQWESGDPAAWEAMMALANAGLATDRATPKFNDTWTCPPLPTT